MRRTSLSCLALSLVILIVSCATVPAGRVKPAAAGAEPVAAAKEEGLEPGAAVAEPSPPASIPAASSGAELSAIPPVAEDKARAAYAERLSRRLPGLCFMVYYKEGSGLDPQAAKLAITQACRYIVERAAKDRSSVSVIDYPSIGKARQEDARPEPLPALAARLGADLYIEIDCSIGSEFKDGKYYASARGGMNIIETSTSALIGSLPFPNQTALSSASQAAAASSALVASVWVSMPKLYDQSQASLAATLERGLRYELSVRKAADAMKLAEFERLLGGRVSGLEVLPASPGEERLALYSFQEAEALRQLIMAAASSAGMPAPGPVAFEGASFILEF